VKFDSTDRNKYINLSDSKSKPKNILKLSLSQNALSNHQHNYSNKVCNSKDSSKFINKNNSNININQRSISREKLRENLNISN